MEEQNKLLRDMVNPTAHKVAGSGEGSSGSDSAPAKEPITKPIITSRIITSPFALRDGPGWDNTKPLFRINEKEKVIALEISGEWVKIQTTAGKEGWIPADYLG